MSDFKSPMKWFEKFPVGTTKAPSTKCKPAYNH
jgi:hypothetical protein